MEVRQLEGYKIITTLGSGGFAKVYAAIHLKTGTKVAIKQISKLVYNEDGEQISRIKREIDIMRRTNSPFVIGLFDVVETESFFYLVIEYCASGTLLSLINFSGRLSEETSKKIFSELVLAVKHLHNDCSVAHRDIKAENILFDTRGNVRLIDFGLSSHPSSPCKHMKTQCGSPTYASPEIICGCEYDFACDIWSCGIVLYAMVCGTLPFSDDNMSRLAQKIVYSECDFPSDLSDDLVDLLRRMLTKDPSHRISLHEILSHPWVSSTVNEISKDMKTIFVDRDTILNKIDSLEIDPVSVSCLTREAMNDQMPSYFKEKQNTSNMKFSKSNPRISKKNINDVKMSPNANATLQKPKTLPINNAPFAKSHQRRKIVMPIIRIK